jgi:hypothetical protein
MRSPRTFQPWIRRLLKNLPLALLLLPWHVLAVPSYARQTGQPCSACHVGGFGPQLTAFGRQFKLLGYSLQAADGSRMPLSAMLVESFTRTGKAQAEEPAKGFSRNDNLELQQVSAFLAGRLTEHLGVFAQATYSENGGVLGWDNIDLRYARTFTGQHHGGIWGVSLNNNPTVTDVFNTAPAWQYPYISADLAPGAPAQPVLFGALGGQVVGLNGYVQVDGALYAEAGVYRSLSPSFLRRVNADYGGRLGGITPYARLAYTWNLPAGSFTLGGFALDVRRGLTTTNAAGETVALAGPQDRFHDLGIDASYQRIGGDHMVTANVLYVHERQRLEATFAADGAEHLHGTLSAWQANASYWYRQTWGATLGWFAADGSRDGLLYPPSGRPDTRGASLELDWNPFGHADSWMQPWANLRLGAQYTHYARFAGRVRNVDDAGRNAHDNDSLFVFLWLAI